ncbi:MAG: type II toxin-antitoxin system HicB family antitoxin [Kiritimatiellae bacterium]|nr:type II toxin-antitoxin system HicB family antitoxin [Kiritimatiellia bacterium]
MEIVIHKCTAPETGYWAEIPSLPGCVSEGETLSEVRRNIVDAAMGCLEASLRWAAKHAPAPTKRKASTAAKSFA